MSVYDNTSGLNNEFIEIYFDEFVALLHADKRKLVNKYDPTNLFLETFIYDNWFENKKSASTTNRGEEESVDFPHMKKPPRFNRDKSCKLISN